MTFDVVVIGGGHAGCEAAWASARMGLRVALVVLRKDRIGFMSCNPAIGGLAKGQIVKEIDALGGVMGRITDRAAIQFRRLNSSKGPAVRSSRAQCDKAQYAVEMQALLMAQPQIQIVEGEVSEILLEGGVCRGAALKDGSRLASCAVVVTTGTFLRALMHTGAEQVSGGRIGDTASIGLGSWFEAAGLRMTRLKTGTPPRLLRQSIDFSKVEEQKGDEKPLPFSFYSRPSPFPLLEQISCYITYTNEKTHEVIEKNFDRSPMFTGVIKGLGPRYCPSIEDKVKRFREKTRHQIFLEPEGLNTDEIYVNGISTSLPRDVQEAFVRSIVGLESAEFVKYGYAVEYDALDSRQLKGTLESKDIENLFFAGQINGTSGYEEAGGQGIIAGINAGRRAQERDEFRLRRDQAYIGVMVDDLVLRGADEPYRMFTSRAEHRLLLREDNADLRLSTLGYEVGLLKQGDFERFLVKKNQIEEFEAQIAKQYWNPGPEINAWLEKKGQPALRDRVSAQDLLKRPEITINSFQELGVLMPEAPEVSEQVEIRTKYAGYIQRESMAIQAVVDNEGQTIPSGLQFETIGGLSSEVLGRLSVARPETIGQLSRLQGITPAAVAAVLIHLKMFRRNGAEKNL